MGNAEVARLRQNTTYKPVLIPQVETFLKRAAAGSRSALKDDSGAGPIQVRLSDPALTENLVATYECIRLLVGSELDTQTQGDRGLGRTTTAFPRLGARFRTSLQPDVAARIGAVLEEICISGFGACAVYDALANLTPTVLRSRDLDELIWQWVTRCIGTWQGWSNSSRNLVEACREEATERLLDIGKEGGLVKGIRQKSQRADLESTAMVVASAGLQLFVALTPWSDEWF